MRISTNVAAVNAARVLVQNDGAMATSLRRLSTGLRITSAADDAAGLSISEGLRSRSRGMTQAVRNVHDGINVVRTAEGALDEVSAALRRMRDLAVQAANLGPEADEQVTAASRVEFEQLREGIDRIARTTTFNGAVLLDGSYDELLQVGAEAGDTMRIAFGAPGEGMGAVDLGLSTLQVRHWVDADTLQEGVGYVGVPASRHAAVSDEEGIPAAGTLRLHGDFTSGEFASTFRSLVGAVRYGGQQLDLTGVDYAGAVTAQDHLDVLNAAAQAALGAGFAPFTATATGLTTAGAVPGPGSTIQDAVDLSPRYLGSGGMAAVIRAVDGAIGRVTELRAGLGAYENRLEHTAARLGVAVENVAAAESRIRDADVAAEVVSLSRHQILVQAGTAMLAQANRRGEGVLRLLAS
ncbi:flagellin N-terminal helical domain-containing protein [Blastococcus sp. SYSU D01042]